MKCVIITEEKIIDLGKRCLSNLRDFVNNESKLEHNEVKRLRTLFFLMCQNIVDKKQKKQNLYLNEESNEVWNEKLEKKFWEAFKYIKESKVGDEKKVEEVFNTLVFEKYSREKFSLKELYIIINFLEEGLDKCKEINKDLYFEIKYFKNIYYFYNSCYKSLVRF